MEAAGPLVEALHWAMLDFWAVIAAIIAALFNTAMAIINQRRVREMGETLEELVRSIRSKMKNGGGSMSSDKPVRDAVRRRLVRFGEEFTSQEVDDGEVELEEVSPDSDPPPEDQQAEPWGYGEAERKRVPRPIRDALRKYREEHPRGNS